MTMATLNPAQIASHFLLSDWRRHFYQFWVFPALTCLIGCETDDNATGSANHAPVIIQTGVGLSPVKTGQQTTLFCQAEDPDDDRLTYTWSVTGGALPEGNQGALAIWTAP